MQDAMNVANLVVPLSALGGVLVVGAMYGRMNTKIEEAHAKIDRAEAERIRRDSTIDAKLDDIHDTLMDMRIMLATRRKNDHHQQEE